MKIRYRANNKDIIKNISNLKAKKCAEYLDFKEVILIYDSQNSIKFVSNIDNIIVKLEFNNSNFCHAKVEELRFILENNEDFYIHLNNYCIDRIIDLDYDNINIGKFFYDLNDDIGISYLSFKEIYDILDRYHNYSICNIKYKDNNVIFKLFKTKNNIRLHRKPKYLYLIYNISNNYNKITSVNPYPEDYYLSEIAKAVIQGDYGNGPERKYRLEKEGYDYNEIQKEINDYIIKNGGML